MNGGRGFPARGPSLGLKVHHPRALQAANQVGLGRALCGFKAGFGYCGGVVVGWDRVRTGTSVMGRRTRSLMGGVRDRGPWSRQRDREARLATCVVTDAGRGCTIAPPCLATCTVKVEKYLRLPHFGVDRILVLRRPYAVFSP